MAGQPSHFPTCVLQMDFSHIRAHKILVWNIRGLNSQEKWDAVRLKINESACNILCLQETKRDFFDNAYIKKFCPRHLDSFAFHPSASASGGLLTVWNGSLYNGDIVQANSYAITLKLSSNLDNSVLHISNVYGPAHSSGKTTFIT
jgi:exonuclease III